MIIGCSRMDVGVDSVIEMMAVPAADFGTGGAGGVRVVGVVVWDACI